MMQTHDTQQTHDVFGFFQAKNHIQVVWFSSCDKMANCRLLVACAEFAASDVQMQIVCMRVRVCIWDQLTHDFVTQKSCKHTTHSKPMTSWMCNEISQSWVSRSCTSGCVCVCLSDWQDCLLSASETTHSPHCSYKLLYKPYVFSMREGKCQPPRLQTYLFIIVMTKET